jgi:outer membrane protein
MQEEIAQMQDKAKRFQAKQEYGPIEKKLNDAVEKVAKANGYDYIGCKFICIPLQSRTRCYSSCKKELGIQ